MENLNGVEKENFYNDEMENFECLTNAEWEMLSCLDDDIIEKGNSREILDTLTKEEVIAMTKWLYRHTGECFYDYENIDKAVLLEKYIFENCLEDLGNIEKLDSAIKVWEKIRELI